MENDKKKPTFEPISAEEAKKIRAYGESREAPPSGLECQSGGDRMYEPCLGKSEGAWCCYMENGGNVYGRCIVDNSGPALLHLRCKTQHEVGPWPPDEP